MTLARRQPGSSASAIMASIALASDGARTEGAFKISATRVVVAILQGDRAAATEAMRSHIMTVWQEYTAYAQATAR